MLLETYVAKILLQSAKAKALNAEAEQAHSADRPGRSPLRRIVP